MRDQTLYGTQGGGTARADEHGDIRFLTAPATGTGLKVGDKVPDDWGLQPIKRTDSSISHAFESAEDAEGMRADTARQQVDAWLSGRISLDNAETLQSEGLPDLSFEDWWENRQLQKMLTDT